MEKITAVILTTPIDVFNFSLPTILSVPPEPIPISLDLPVTSQAIPPTPLLDNYQSDLPTVQSTVVRIELGFHDMWYIKDIPYTNLTRMGVDTVLSHVRKELHRQRRLSQGREAGGENEDGNGCQDPEPPSEVSLEIKIARALLQRSLAGCLFDSSCITLLPLPGMRLLIMIHVAVLLKPYLT